MAELTVSLKRLEPMRVAVFRAWSETPEADAWRSLRAWAAPRGLIADAAHHPVFGFNNPPPAAGRSGYGYELWIRVDDGETDAATTTVFEGGLYATATTPLNCVPATWRALWEWAQRSSTRWRRVQELERVLNPEAPESEMVVELYLPVTEIARP